MGVTQDLAHTCLSSIEDADPELVAEETLCLVATATARAVEVGAGDKLQALSAVAEVLSAIPFTYREYLVGGAMVAQKKPELADMNRIVAQRLERKLSFYRVHLPPAQFPGRHALNDKMAFWMGRISPPGLPETPIDRLEKLDVVETLLTHLQLVLAYVRKEVSSG